MSTQTTDAPTALIAAESARSVFATVMTSSPGPIPSARSAAVRVAVP
jgi:hypothetical protein